MSALPACCSASASRASSLPVSQASRAPVQGCARADARDRHLRQRHRVRISPFLAKPFDEDVLLRPPCSLAERRHRERHRLHAPLHPPQDRSRQVPTRRLVKSIAAYNNTPRKCLDFRTPAETFAAQVLHFECESTHPPNPRREATVLHRYWGPRGTGRNRLDRATRCFRCHSERWDTEENSVVAEGASSEPTAKNYSLGEELAQHRGILRWFCGRFEQSDTGESCGVAWRRGSQSIPFET
ncbi:hypothetical protein ABIA96_006415 [Bradyrhizobium sp. LB11.1]